LRVLATERLILEPLTARHAEEMFGGLSDAGLYEFLVERPPQSVEWLRQRYERLTTRQSDDGRERWWNWVLRLNDGELVGYVQATIQNAEAEIAYVLFRPYWSRGIAVEAVGAMIGELAGVGVTSISACTDRENLRSRRLLERLGFEERPLPEYRREDGADDVWYVLDP
jgi:[ribosomal protein S5]-alanine N-acetyltransferase